MFDLQNNYYRYCAEPFPAVQFDSETTSHHCIPWPIGLTLLSVTHPVVTFQARRIKNLPLSLSLYDLQRKVNRFHGIATERRRLRPDGASQSITRDCSARREETKATEARAGIGQCQESGGTAAGFTAARRWTGDPGSWAGGVGSHRDLSQSEEHRGGFEPSVATAHASCAHRLVR